MNTTLRKLDWDSAFFGFRIGRLEGKVTNGQMSSVMAWCRKEGIRCLYLLADSSDIETVLVAEIHGFALKDIRLTMRRKAKVREHRPSKRQTGVLVRHARADDVASLELIASSAFLGTRFYVDAHFPREKADELYRTWIRRSCEGYADKVLVAENDGKVAGFVTCHLNPSLNGNGTIGLLGVAQEERGKRVGEQLLNNCIQWFDERRAIEVDVATQGKNIAAQRLYQRQGFFSNSIQLWYHKWFQ